MQWWQGQRGLGSCQDAKAKAKANAATFNQERASPRVSFF
jgi:hypothetical protein